MFFIVLVELIVIVFILSRFSKHTSKNLIPHESDLPIHPFIGNENDPFLGYKLKKNFFQLYDGDIIKLERTTTIETNSFGIRDREFQVPKPNNTVRIIILGDSFTFGLGVELNETYAKILEDKLNKLETEKTYEVLNFGVPGYNTTQEIEFFKLYGIQFEPDIIILAYTGDDLQDSVGTLEMKKQYIIKKFGEDYNVSDPRVFREIVRINYIISEKNIRKNLIKPDYKIYEILNTSFMKLKAIISPDTPIIIVKFPTSEKETYALKKIGLRRLILERYPALLKVSWLNFDPHPPVSWRIIRLEELEDYPAENPQVLSIKECIRGLFGS